MGGVVFGQLVGYLLDHGFGYGVVFMLAGSFHVLAFAMPSVWPIPTIGPLCRCRRHRHLTGHGQLNAGRTRWVW